MPKSLKTGMVFLLAVCVLFSLTGCADKKEQEYKTNMTAAIADISSNYTAFAEAVEAYFEDRLAVERRAPVLDTLTALTDAYGKLETLEAPGDYQEVQKLLSEGAALAKEAVSIYREELEGLTEENFNEAALERIQAGDQKIQEAYEKILAGASKGQEIDGMK